MALDPALLTAIEDDRVRVGVVVAPLAEIDAKDQRIAADEDGGDDE